jgi:hypothetical protein
MELAASWERWRFAAGAGLLLFMGFFPFVRGTRVPLLGWIDLAIHEFGHLFWFFLPEVGTAMMGNGTQVLLPLTLACVFLFRERDWLGTVVCLGWAGTSMQDASVYIADAPYQRLPLIGGYHDWAFALAELGQLHRAEAIGRLVWVAGLVLLLLAAAGCALGPQVEPAVAARPRRSRRLPAATDEPAANAPAPPAPHAPAHANREQPGRTPDRPIPHRDADWRNYFS